MRKLSALIAFAIDHDAMHLPVQTVLSMYNKSGISENREITKLC